MTSLVRCVPVVLVAAAHLAAQPQPVRQPIQYTLRFPAAKNNYVDVEARVPAAVTCALEGPEQGQPMKAWATLGITKVDGSPLPGADGEREAFLMMPAGRFGPAFIVTPNFYTLKLYNNSDLYALYIGHLADRMAGAGAFAAAWGKMPAGFTRPHVQAMQQRLVKEGYDVGKADGLIGFKTRIAVGKIQEKRGDKPTCWPDAAMVRG